MFSNDSRWDRHLPHDVLEEDVIEVGAVFRGGEVIPRCFIWKESKYHIQEVTYHWQDKRGGDVLHFFSVSDGVNLYLIHVYGNQSEWDRTPYLDQRTIARRQTEKWSH